MILGIVSDSHGRVERLQAALILLDRLGAGTLVHCGDVGGMDTFDVLIGRDVRFVWGNTDAPSPGEMAYLDNVGLLCPRAAPLRIELAGKRIEVFHGHEADFHAALRDPQVDYILHGHTHVARDERIGGARVINPGALYRARTYTVATLDLLHDVVEFHRIGAHST